MVPPLFIGAVCTGQGLPRDAAAPRCATLWHGEIILAPHHSARSRALRRARHLADPASVEGRTLGVSHAPCRGLAVTPGEAA